MSETANLPHKAHKEGDWQLRCCGFLCMLKDARVAPIFQTVAWLRMTVSEIAASAATASFQKSRRCLSPGRPSGFMIWMTIRARMTRDRTFDMLVFEQAGAGLSKLMTIVERQSLQDSETDPIPC
jgi:hypothetical protein